jgi:hypothetical protein
MPYLDPRNIDPNSCRRWVPRTLPAEVREFGFYPDIDLLKPGDLVLVRNLDGNWTHRLIERFQKKLGYHERDFIWHHAAVYLGVDGKICEADLDGVRYGSLDRYSSGNHFIRIRRAPNLSDNQRWQIAVKSLVELNKRYSVEHLWELFRLAQFRLGRAPTKRVKPPKAARICSELYEDAFCKVTAETLSNPDDGEITPACLSRTDKLEDVSANWLLIS